MATNHTTNYQLCQWEATDKVLRTDFNEDNQKIDAALATIPKIVAGSYTGDGAAERVIPLGFTPKLLFLSDMLGVTASIEPTYTHYFGGLVTSEMPCTVNGITFLSIVEGGFKIICQLDDSGNSHTTSYTGNNYGATYRYWAVG